MNQIARKSLLERLFGRTASKPNPLKTQQDLKSLIKQNPPRPQFHPLSKSPHEELREYHRLIQEYSSCPSCLDIGDKLEPEQWNDIQSIPGGTSRSEPAPKSTLRPLFDCPQCGFPTHCSADHHHSDMALHRQVCPSLRQWNEDEHDSRSGRKFWEMCFPGRQEKNSLLNFTSWAYLLATRKFPREVLQNAVSQRHISRFLTYPYTIASLLYNPWAYAEEKPDGSGSVVTEAGWHLISGISHSLEVGTRSAMQNYDQHRGPKQRVSFTGEPTAPTLLLDPFRIFILGPRVECQLPAFVWEQLSMTFPGVPFRLYFIGPESRPSDMPVTSTATQFRNHRTITPSIRTHHRPLTSHNSETTSTVESLVQPVSVNLRMEYIQLPYEQVHEHFGPFQRNRDIFILFNSGIGHFATREQWKPALDKIFETKCLTIFTSLNSTDQQRDIATIKEQHEGKYVVAIRPTHNKFASMRPDVSVDCVHDPDQWVYCNWGVFALHGIGTDLDRAPDSTQLESTDSDKPSWFSFKWSW